MQCVALAVTNPAGDGKLRILNQFTETFSVSQLAEMVRETGARAGYNVEVSHVENPREEQEEHYYNPKHSGLVELGLKPHLLSEEVLLGFFRTVEGAKDRIDPGLFFKGVSWK